MINENITIHERLTRLELKHQYTENWVRDIHTDVKKIDDKMDQIISKIDQAEGAKKATTFIGHAISGFIGAVASVGSYFTFFTKGH